MPSKVLSFIPSTRARWDASSRLGPTTPVVPARASVWQAPHLETNRVLPLITFDPEWVIEQPASATAATAAAPAMTTCVRIGRGILPIGEAIADQGSGSPSRRPCAAATTVRATPFQE